MTTALLVAIALACQVILVSILMPRGLVNAAQASMSDALDPPGSRRANFRRYLRLNYAVASMGLVCLVICTAFYFRRLLSVTGLLLGIGIVFLVQVLPLALLFGRGMLPMEQDSSGDGSNKGSAAAVRNLFDVLPFVPVAIAVGLYFAYVTTMGTLWICTGTDQLPKLVSITLTNAAFAFALIWTYSRLLRATDERIDRYRELARMGPLLTFASILVTIYFFAKEILFALDLEEARPIMMSVALQLVAVAVFYAISGPPRNRTMPYTGAGD